MGERPDGGREGPRANGPDPPAIFSPVPHSGPAPRPARPAPAPPRRRPAPRRWTAAAALALAVIGGAVAAREFWSASSPPEPSPPPPQPAAAPATEPPSGLAAALQGAFDAVLPESGMTVRSVRTLPPSGAPGGPLLVAASSPAGEAHIYEVAMTRSAGGWNITARRRTPAPPPVPAAITPGGN